MKEKKEFCHMAAFAISLLCKEEIDKLSKEDIERLAKALAGALDGLGQAHVHLGGRRRVGEDASPL